jgi:PAS domain S-box-containing protein
VLTSGKKLGFEEKIGESTFSFTFAPIVSEGYVNAYAEDITERKKAEQAVIDSEERFRAIAQVSPVQISVSRASDGAILFTNPAYNEAFGFAEGELAGRKAPDLYWNPADRLALINALKERGFVNNYEVKVKRKDGMPFWVSASIREIRFGAEPAVLGASVNITDRRQAEIELRETRDYLDNLLNYANAPIIVWNPDFCITKFNRAFERLTGLSSNDAVGKNLGSLFPLDMKEQAMAHIKRTLEGEYWETVEIPIVHVDGTVRTLLWNSANIYDSDGKKIIATIAQGQDITERKKAEQALHESQHDLNHAQAVAKTGSWRLYTQRNELLWSDENHRMFGIPKGTPMTYETFLSTVHPDDRKYVDREWKAGLRGEPYDIEHRIVVNGEIKWVREKAELEFDRNGLLLGGFGTTQEITERKEMQAKLEDYSKHLEELVEEKTKQLKDAERLATIGETAGMIGHDIRNPLQAIIGELYLSKDSLHSLPESEAKQELADSMRAIEEQASYINKIVTDLQDYAKPLAPCIEDVKIENIVESILPTMGIPENTEVTYLIEEGFPTLRIDSSYIKRILTNLAANAVQAMPNGGKLTINAYHRDNRAFVSVEDTGEGISEEAKSKLFKPLFTTKAKGQGFGLAVVKKLTEALNGTITFESQEGKGTKFIIELPTTNTNHTQ